MKILVAVILTLAVSLTGFVLYQNNVISMKAILALFEVNQSGPAEPQNIEVQIENVLVPINLGKRQSLLLLDVSLFTPKGNAPYLEEQLSRVKNRIIKKFSVKDLEYFHDKQFIYVLQDDLKDELDELPTLQIGDVLVTKAVFQ
ncbi:flagellar biosynthesis sigma factor [Photobacterium sp. BZF1]|uniref:flagellar basal body-associated FliL family protein n=1 Tax=Photobacterium sp. BZF1 TaxID=1904457 RepID=UPI0016537CF2|nr:flagellar basal body-associated FliL family protein [Photobacterium sp. BZF1]MBC7001621.1 flagellar biosynthesis sigma factor [Photobacterium sp. BZF1]